ncbi:MAG: hypothetical protein KAU38_12890 [Desulfobacterales bacterium]|nr:hypothetical protein [Desulfobacterales bacterium]
MKAFSCGPEQVAECPENKLKNNLSLVSYIQYLDTEIVFPGDLEPLGWKAFLNNTKIKDYVGKAKCRILVAPHHGRKSGIRDKSNGREYVYDEFLKLMNPNLVIMSDKWGTETTDPDAYRPSCEGYPVTSRTSRELKTKDVLTTKTNQYILIKVSGQNRTPSVSVP